MKRHKKDIKIYIVSHKKPYKKVWRKGYTYIGVGKRINYRFPIYDDSFGVDNISHKNPYYSELTAHYWIWKHSTYEIIGVMHYRRWFVKENRNRLYNKKFFINNVDDNTVIMGKPLAFNISIYNHYALYRDTSELDLTYKIIEEIFPDYKYTFKKIMDGNSMHACNMLICTKKTFGNYCFFLFTILSQLEQKFGYTRERLYGYVGEWLMDVFFKHNKYKIIELNVLKLQKP